MMDAKRGQKVWVRCATCDGTGEVKETRKCDNIDGPMGAHSHDVFYECPTCEGECGKRVKQ